jgi:hypothetical protein
MNTRRKIIAGCAATIALAAGGVTAGAVTAAATPRAAVVHTIRFVAHRTGSHQFTQQTSAATETDRRNGKIVGYDMLRFHFTKSSGVVNGAVVLQRGLIYFRVPLNSSGPVFTGPLTGGAVAFRGVKGTITARPRNSADTVTAITIRYHF